MRIRITGSTRAFSHRVARLALRFYASVLIPKFRKVNLSVIFTDKISASTGAEMWRRGRWGFSIRVSSRNGPYRTLQDIAHEMIHVEQFLTGALADIHSGSTWHGKLFRGDFLKSNDTYWNAPWEINAHGRSYWLYKRCRKHLRKLGVQLRKSP